MNSERRPVAGKKHHTVADLAGLARAGGEACWRRRRARHRQRRFDESCVHAVDPDGVPRDRTSRCRRCLRGRSVCRRSGPHSRERSPNRRAASSRGVRTSGRSEPGGKHLSFPVKHIGEESFAISSASAYARAAPMPRAAPVLAQVLRGAGGATAVVIAIGRSRPKFRPNADVSLTNRPT